MRPLQGRRTIQHTVLKQVDPYRILFAISIKQEITL